MKDVPEVLRTSAEQARLGRLRAVDRAAAPARRAVVRFVVVVVAMVLSGLIGWLVESRGAPGALRYVALLVLFLAFVPFGRSLRDVVVGAETTCVHERGVVVGNRRAAVPLTWRGTRTLERVRRGPTLLGWDLRGKDDRTHRVLLKGTARERADAATALEDAAHRARVPITERTDPAAPAAPAG